MSELGIQGDSSIVRRSASVTYCNVRSSSTSLYTGYDPASGWRVSPEQSASRALAILACLQVLSRDPSEWINHSLSTGTQIITHPSGLKQDVEVVSAFYVASLRDLVGEAYYGPSLPFLAIAWVRYPGAHLDTVY